MIPALVRSLRRRFVFALAVIGLLATARLAAEAPHPSVLLTAHKGKMLPVVKVVGTEPVVVSEGKETRLEFVTAFDVERAPYFGEGRVDFQSFQGSGQGFRTLDRGFDPTNQKLGGTISFAAEVTSATPLTGAFLALILFNEPFLLGKGEAQPEILITALPDLAAGKPTELKFGFVIKAIGRTAKCLPLVFSAGGASIRGNQDDFAAQYFSLVEKRRLEQLLPKYRAQNPTADRAASPVLTFQPILSAGLTPPAAPVAATLTIGEAGIVTEVQFPDDLDANVSMALRETLKGWLFLPRLKAGQPVSSRVQIPLKF